MLVLYLLSQRTVGHGHGPVELLTCVGNPSRYLFFLSDGGLFSVWQKLDVPHGPHPASTDETILYPTSWLWLSFACVCGCAGCTILDSQPLTHIAVTRGLCMQWKKCLVPVEVVRKEAEDLGIPF